jgi:hypothetical protein
MTRHEFLQRLEVERRRQRGRLLRLMVLLQVFTVGGLVLVGSGQVLGGLSAILLFGLGGGLMILPGLVVPAPRYAGGRLEARVDPAARLSLLLSLTAITASAVVTWPVAPLKVRVALAVLGAAAAVGAVLVAYAMRQGGVVIIIDAQGYFDRRNMAEPIPWRRVMALNRWEMRQSVIYRMRIDDDGPLPSKVATREGVFGGVLVGGVGLTCTGADMLLAIQAYRPDLIDTLVGLPQAIGPRAAA